MIIPGTYKLPNAYIGYDYLHRFRGFTTDFIQNSTIYAEIKDNAGNLLLNFQIIKEDVSFLMQLTNEQTEIINNGTYNYNIYSINNNSGIKLPLITGQIEFKKL